MSEAVWSDTLSLNVPAMDEIHQEFVEALAALQGAEDGEFLARLDDMAAHCRMHFDQENAWMKALNFPPRPCHEEEHHKVLLILWDVKQQVKKGDLALGRNMARELMPWLEHHAATMDDLLAKYIQEQGYQAVRSLKA